MHIFENSSLTGDRLSRLETSNYIVNVFLINKKVFEMRHKSDDEQCTDRLITLSFKTSFDVTRPTSDQMQLELVECPPPPAQLCT